MIEFFRDVLSGPLYIIVVIVAVILIMAIIGFLMERKKLEKEEKEKIAIVGTQNIVPPITPVAVEEKENVVNTEQATKPLENNATSSVTQEQSSLEVKTPVIVFEDPDQKNE